MCPLRNVVRFRLKNWWANSVRWTTLLSDKSRVPEGIPIQAIHGYAIHKQNELRVELRYRMIRTRTRSRISSRSHSASADLIGGTSLNSFLRRLKLF